MLIPIRTFRIGVLLVSLLAITTATCADHPVPPASLEAFRKLTPEERLRLLEKAGDRAKAVRKVANGVLNLDVVERGSLEAANNHDVICTFKQRSNSSPLAAVIKWLIDEGVTVKKGDKLIEYDDDFLREKLKARTLDLDNAVAGHAKARENLTLVQNENRIEVRLTEIKLRFAELQLKQYKGEDRDKQETLQLKAEQAALLVQRAKAQAITKQSEAMDLAKAKAVLVDQAKLGKRDAEAELPKCTIYAPMDGLVIYYVPEQSGNHGPFKITAQNEPVREGQKLMRISDISKMLVVTGVPEIRVADVRGADPKTGEPGQRAQIRVDAFPGQVLTGHVQSVDPVAIRAEPLGSVKMKLYRTIVSIDGPTPRLRPGMSAEVRIELRTTKGAVLHVPAEAIVTVGKKRFCFVVTDKAVEEREVLTGISNNRSVQILSGLEEGESVLVSPPVSRSSRPSGKTAVPKD